MRAGLEQRIRAINHYIHDVYHRREILKAGIVPEELGVPESGLSAGDEWSEGPA